MPTEYPAHQRVLQPGDPEAIEAVQFDTTADAIRQAMTMSRAVDDEDPDPYGVAQEIAEEYGVTDILPARWRSRPSDFQWVKRMKARERRAEVSKMFIQGQTVQQMAATLEVTEVTIYRDLASIEREWRQTYLGNTEKIAAADLARLDSYLSYLAPNIERGDVNSIKAAIEIIKSKSEILGTKQGVQVDIEQYVRQVAEANGYDPDRAVQLAQRISITMR